MIEVRDLYKEYQNKGEESKVIAVNHVSFEMKDGDFVAVMGPSGSGKTTILNLVNGLDRPTSGEVLYDGKNIYEMNDDELADMRLRHMGTVFQTYNLIPELSVYENVVLPIKIAKRKANMQKVDHLLEQLGLIDRKNFMPDQLSGGQQQRVAIARAMINDPKILFCDEPTGNLDKKTGDEVMDILKMLNKKWGLVLWLLHMINLWRTAVRRSCICRMENLLLLAIKLCR